MSQWSNAQSWELNWHGNSVNEYGEQAKQLVYLRKMGFKQFLNTKTPYLYDMMGKSVLDIGSGPTSALLLCTNFLSATVLDPSMNDYPKWVRLRYKSAGIDYISCKAEELDVSKFYDSVIMYNCLQHTENPEKIIKNALMVCREFHIFEWINTFIDAGHLHSFTNNQLNGWLWGTGKVEELHESGCDGMAYYGIFKGNRYDG
jgi:2-polyprenyl-3-methyl-5-hydroxy-6-metoxy-1,4-benzoquinol methylase